MFTCIACPGTRIELALYRNGTDPGIGAPAAYHLRETAYGKSDGDQVTESNGFWTEHRGPSSEEIIDLASGRPDGMKFFQRVERNGGELVALDGDLHELPANVPHTLARITGDRQLTMQRLSAADNGRVVELRPGEVFQISLAAGDPPGYTWSSNRPDSMALVEVGGPLPKVAQPGLEAAPVPPSPALVGRPKGRPPAPAPTYFRGDRVWQMIAPPPGTVTIRFDYTRLVSGTVSVPLKIFTLTVVTR